MPRKRKPKSEVNGLPSRFVPQFWMKTDRRSLAVREVRRRYRELKDHTGADSSQKDMLCQRAVFIGVQLETMEIEAVEGKAPLDAGRYTQMVNALLGLLKALGLERQMKRVVDLKAYVEGCEP